MIANYLYRFSPSSAVLDLIASRRKRRVSGDTLQLSAGPGHDRRPPQPAALPTPEDRLQAEINALQDPERWDGMA